ncbi:MAG: IctB family putative bicarbonate transporter, partial [Microcoleaceae cyanobacterium]
MSEIWQNITLSHLHPAQWKNTSYLYHWLSGSLREWRQSSFLMQWAETIGFLLIALVFALSPFVSNTLIGLLLIAGVAFWVLLTLSDESLETFSPIHLLVLAYWGIAVIATALSPVKAAALTGLVKLTLYLLFFTFMARVLQTSKFRKWLIAIYLHISLIVSI